MKIGPIDSGGRPLRPDNDSQGRAASQSEQIKGRESESAADSVEISRQARELAQQRDHPDPSTKSESQHETTQISSEDTEVQGQDSNPASKIDHIRKRVANGHYDRPETKKNIARRIADDFIG